MSKYPGLTWAGADSVYPVSFSFGLANVSQCKLTQVGSHVLKWAGPNVI